MVRASFKVGIVTWALLAASQVSATTQPDYTLKELVEQSTHIVRATAVSVSPKGHYDPAGIPCTRVTLSVEEVLKGEVEEGIIEFCTAGGIEEDERISVPIGLPTFTEDSTYLLFLKGSDWAFTPVVSWTKGALREVQHGNRSVFVTSEGDIVEAVNDKGVAAGPPAARPELARLLSQHGLEFGARRVDPQTKAVETTAERGARFSAALVRGARADAVLATVRAAIAEHQPAMPPRGRFDAYQNWRLVMTGKADK